MSDRARAAALVALAATVPFLPALGNGWVNWDDPIYLLENNWYRGLSRENLRWMFTARLSSHYQPMVWLTYALDFKLWGMNPAGYHLTTLLLHGFNAALFFLLALRLLAKGSVAGAAFAALLFAVHPLRVESVAWAAQRRDVLCGTLYLATVLTYLRGEDSARWRAVSVGLFGAALLSKAIALTLPAALLVLEWRPLGRLDPGPDFGARARRVFARLVPYALAAAAMSAVALGGEAQGRSLWSWEQHGLGARLAQCGYGLCFYLSKTLFPAGLSPIYELPFRLDPGAFPYPLTAAAAAGITFICWRLRNRRPEWAAAWLVYGITLSPVLGLTQSGPQIAADRYTYLPGLPLALLAGAGLDRWRAAPGGRRTAALAAGALVLALAAAAWRQTLLWRDSETLWTHAVLVQPRSSIAHNNLGTALTARGALAPAAARFEEALAVNPVCIEAQRRLVGFARTGGNQEELAHWRGLYDTNPACRSAWANLVTARAAQGQFAPALRYYGELLILEPANAHAHNNLGLALAGSGCPEEARKHFSEALRLDPSDPRAGGNLRRLPEKSGREAPPCRVKL